jgi:hypothetical protein
VGNLAGITSNCLPSLVTVHEVPVIVKLREPLRDSP